MHHAGDAEASAGVLKYAPRRGCGVGGRSAEGPQERRWPPRQSRRRAPRRPPPQPLPTPPAQSSNMGVRNGFIGQV
eukprot:1193720-Prorocentrum_minimum.AAC.1